VFVIMIVALRILFGLSARFRENIQISTIQ
jgi:hypothetical protein